jgi:hypothetical protein
MSTHRAQSSLSDLEAPGETRSLTDQAVTPKECQKMITASGTHCRSKEPPPQAPIIAIGSV